MKLQLLDTEGEQIRQIASAWLQQSSQHLLADEYKQARSILHRVWAITNEEATDLASSAAWRLAWMLLRHEEFAEAADWFGRIENVDTIEHKLWPIERATQVALCHVLAERRICPDLPLTTSVSASGLRVCNLGRFHLLRGEIELPNCRSRKAIQLLRYLLTRDGWRASRDELIDMLWPAVTFERAVHNLHVVVNLLRRHIDERDQLYLNSAQQAYAINGSARLVDDTRCFRDRCHQADADWRANRIESAERDYREAIALYVGDYVVDDPDMIWQVIEQQRLLSCYLTALERLGHMYCQQGRHAEALAPFERLILCDSYREDIHRALMECYQQLGRRNDALRQYRACVAALNHDIGIEPLAETTALYCAIAGIDLAYQ
jgi:DNA-binding SARP family transcriptional activator